MLAQASVIPSARLMRVVHSLWILLFCWVTLYLVFGTVKAAKKLMSKESTALTRQQAMNVFGTKTVITEKFWLQDLKQLGQAVKRRASRVRIAGATQPKRKLRHKVVDAYKTIDVQGAVRPTSATLGDDAVAVDTGRTAAASTSLSPLLVTTVRQLSRRLSSTVGGFMAPRRPQSDGPPSVAQGGSSNELKALTPREMPVGDK